MRLLRVVPAALILCGSGPLFAQGWAEYASPADFFSVNFPGEPTVGELAYTSEYEAEFPARVHAYEDGAARYAVTVVDYSEAEPIHTERARNCPPDDAAGRRLVQLDAPHVVTRWDGRWGLRVRPRFAAVPPAAPPRSGT